MATTINPKHRLLAPEVVQTSAMDCGPASLKCLLEGFGIQVSYGRLREACQTDVDGTSIDAVEEVAARLGLEAEQVMIPVDHLLLAEAGAIPAIAVVLSPMRATHFVVLWRRHRHLVQVMDPATGRQWSAREEVLKSVYVHTTAVAAARWREWAGTDSFLSPLRRRLLDLKVPHKLIRDLIAEATADSEWRGVAALDAATRMVGSLVRAGGIARGRQAASVVKTCLHEAMEEGAAEAGSVPASYWSVRPAPQDPEGQEQLSMRGAVLIQVHGRRTAEPPRANRRSGRVPAIARTRRRAGGESEPTGAGAFPPTSRRRCVCPDNATVGDCRRGRLDRY